MNIQGTNPSMQAPEWSPENRHPSRPPSGFTAEQISRKIGHELRSQLTGTSGLLDLLLETDLNPSQAAFAESIKGSIMTMLYMVNGIHDMIRLENGTFKPANSRFNLRRLFEDHEFLFKTAAEERGLQIAFTVFENAHDELLGDSRRLGVILFHLISNAIHFADSGMVRVSALALMDDENTMHHSATPAQRILFEVTDEGEGIPDEVHQAFLNEKSISHSLFLNKGMGLLTCRELIANLGGEIRLQSSSPERGSSVQFWLPFQVVGSSREETDEPQQERIQIKDQFHETAHTTVAGSHCVLLADDDPVNRKFVSTLLNKHGIATHCVGNGEKAVEAYRSRSFQLVILDCNMPVKTGFEATRQIREIAAERDHSTPIIVWSATNSELEKNMALAAGADRFLLKPVDSRSLLSVVTEMLAERS
jgi:hypothetical protein